MSDNPFLDPEFLKCPFPMFKQLRDDAPIMFMEQMGMYLVIGYDQVHVHGTDGHVPGYRL